MHSLLKDALLIILKKTRYANLVETFSTHFAHNAMIEQLAILATADITLLINSASTAKLKTSYVCNVITLVAHSA